MNTPSDKENNKIRLHMFHTFDSEGLTCGIDRTKTHECTCGLSDAIESLMLDVISEDDVHTKNFVIDEWNDLESRNTLRDEQRARLKQALAPTNAQTEHIKENE